MPVTRFLPPVWRFFHNSTRQHLRRIWKETYSVGSHFWASLFPFGDLKSVRGTGLLLNLGCGRLIVPGWINIDCLRASGIYFADLRDPLTLPDGCARRIHCEHVLEHLEYEDAKSFLKECHRLLEPGGVMRVIVPDAEKYLRAYGRDDRAFFERMKFVGDPSETHSCETPIEALNRVFSMFWAEGGHKFAWDFETLELRLKRAGFSEVRRTSFQSEPPPYAIDGTDSWRLEESLYVNAVK